MQQEREPQSQPLPIISNEIGKRLLEDFGVKTIDPSPSIESLSQAINESRSFKELSTQQTEAVFGDLLSMNPLLVQSISETIQQNPTDAVHVDSAVLGMAIVLKAYDIQTEHGLLSNFGLLEQPEIETVKRILQKLFSSPPTTILQRLLNSPRIPEQQVTLNQTIQQIAITGNHWSPNSVKLGASTMYHVLGALWPKLFPQGEPQTQPPSQ